MSQTLGDRLRAQMAAVPRVHVTRKQAWIDDAMEATRRHKRAIRNAFEDIKESVISAIERSRPLRPFRLPSVFLENGQYRTPISAPEHPDHHLWRDFAAWLDENGLTATVAYDHDCAGMEGWFNLTVEPAKGTMTPVERLLADAASALDSLRTDEALAHLLAALREACTSGAPITDEAGLIDRMIRRVKETRPDGIGRFIEGDR